MNIAKKTHGGGTKLVKSSGALQPPKLPFIIKKALMRVQVVQVK